MPADTITFPWETPPPEGEPREVFPGLSWLRMPLPMALDHVNCWILDDPAQDGVTIVDTGIDSEHGRALWEQALGGRRVAQVIVTHHHPDHMGLAGWFAETHGARLFMSRAAYLMGRILQLDRQERPSSETLSFWHVSGMDPDELALRREERPFHLGDVTCPLPLEYVRLLEGMQLQAGGIWWTVRMGEGHGPEHATLWSETNDVVIGGDQVLPTISANVSVYVTEPQADPLTDWLASCERLMGFARAETFALPGHGLPYRGLPRRFQQMIDGHAGALDRLEAHLAKPHLAADCFSVLFRRKVGRSEYGLALGEALAHCLHLWHMGRATRETDPDGRWLFRAAPELDGTER